MVLVTGFLGSGKTTLLAEFARRLRGRSFAWIVNEFAPLDVDGRMVRPESGEVLPISGGSIFCTCRLEKFLDVLKHTIRAGAAGRLEGVVVEASGMANPGAAERMIGETKLQDDLRLARIITVVDPVTLPKLLATLPALKSQVEAADDLVLNKVDLVSEAEADAAEARLRELNPRARIHRCAFGRADIDPFEGGSDDSLGGAAPRGLWGEYIRCKDPWFSHTIASVPGPLAEERLRALLDSRGGAIHRLKGFCRMEAGGWSHVEWTASSGLRVEPAEDAGEAGALVLICETTKLEAATELAMAIEESVEAAVAGS